MIIIQQTVPDELIRKEAADAIPLIKEWFKNNPKRRICRSEGWYGVQIFVRRGHVNEDIAKAAHEAISRGKK